MSDYVTWYAWAGLSGNCHFNILPESKLFRFHCAFHITKFQLCFSEKLYFDWIPLQYPWALMCGGSRVHNIFNLLQDARSLGQIRSMSLTCFWRKTGKLFKLARNLLVWGPAICVMDSVQRALIWVAIASLPSASKKRFRWQLSNMVNAAAHESLIGVRRADKWPWSSDRTCRKKTEAVKVVRRNYSTSAIRLEPRSRRQRSTLITAFQYSFVWNLL
jgi:hypothetical protein